MDKIVVLEFVPHNKTLKVLYLQQLIRFINKKFEVRSRNRLSKLRHYSIVIRYSKIIYE